MPLCLDSLLMLEEMVIKIFSPHAILCSLLNYIITKCSISLFSLCFPLSLLVSHLLIPSLVLILQVQGCNLEPYGLKIEKEIEGERKKMLL